MKKHGIVYKRPKLVALEKRGKEAKKVGNYKRVDSTILDLVKHYSKLLEKFERKRMPKPKVKGRIHLDEVGVKVGKNVLLHKRHRREDQIQLGLQASRKQNP